MTAKTEHSEQESQAGGEEPLVGEVVNETEVEEEEVVVGEEVANGEEEDDGTETLTDENGLELAAELIERTKERDEYKDQALRLRAEFDNYRKRMARESSQMRKTATKTLVEKLLPVMDNLQRALEHVDDKSGNLAEGVEMVLKQFSDAFQAQGVEVIPALGESFDPNLHEALSQLPSDEYASGVVMQEFLRGYRMGDYILRHSQVVVSSGPAASETVEESGDSPEAGDTPKEDE